MIFEEHVCLLTCEHTHGHNTHTLKFAQHLPPALLLVIRPWACLVVEQRADQGRGLLGVRAQVGRQDHGGGDSSSLRVDGQL